MSTDVGDDETTPLRLALVDALGLHAAPEADEAIAGLVRLSGGASRETWSFVVASRRLILQRVRPGGSLGGPTMAVEDRLLAEAAAEGVPVPVVVADSGRCAAAGLVESRITEHVDGEALGPKVVRSEAFAPARRLLVGQCGVALAGIHSLDPARFPELERVEPLERLRLGLDLVGEARPAFELALRWLADHRPDPGPPAVVHGDFRVGNLLVDPTDGLRAVLDWELAHVGDPVEDLGWLCVRAWRFGGSGAVGGIGAVVDLLASYADAGGRPVAPEHLHWWVVAGTVTWGLICAIQARRHLDGHVRSVELATIGRRVAETEHDLLDLLDLLGYLAAHTEGTTDPDRSPARSASPSGPAELAARVEALTDALAVASGSEDAGDRLAVHGRPTATELLDAVRGHLATGVATGQEGAAAFQQRVAANAVAIVERELASAAASAAALDGLRAAGYPDERALATAIHVGDVDAAPGTPTIDALVALVHERVRVANPRWLTTP